MARSHRAIPAISGLLLSALTSHIPAFMYNFRASLFKLSLPDFHPTLTSASKLDACLEDDAWTTGNELCNFRAGLRAPAFLCEIGRRYHTEPALE